ncbi:phosphohydrolase [Sporomusaceae bacterium FL31]|nr:phosphohydrolase [Sporomusaceae bacterium FL31]GCE35869.1 phosphohydrolase [Sporomusaceae bacterium]
MKYLPFMILFCTIYGAANYYIGMRTWDALHQLIPLAPIAYWCIIIFLTVSYVVSSIWNSYYPTKPLNSLLWIGSYWLAMTYYAFLLWVFVDILSMVNSFIGLLALHLNKQPFIAITLWTIIAIVMIYGRWVATHPIVNRYQLRLNKRAGNLSSLHAVLIADVHLGPLVGTTQLAKMVSTIQQLQPDIVFFAGDMIDENVPYFIAEKMPEQLKKITPPFGVFAVLGNHEYIGGYGEQAIKALEQSGVTVLRDSFMKVADSFYVIGRDDRSSARFARKQRLSLATMLKGLDQSLPLILLDHQPNDFSEAERSAIDLQLSGHTHRGQFFPNNLITEKVFELDWGYLAKESFHVIVSSGYATWGPPIRLGNHPEVVEILIEFKQD